ncbi:MAG: AraC family transcriptional regulator [Clostridiales bacterium]|jgi:AraC family transcriptional regulator|nr:AraC family transcriptional regulator [Clostridiales bacterium]
MKNQNPAINSSVEFIEQELTQEINVSKLAERLFFSKTHFQRLFRETVGEPVMEYVKKRRLELARLEIEQTNATVLDISLKYGYFSHEGFTRAFKAYFGITPSLARKSKNENLHYLKEEIEMMPNDVMIRIKGNLEKIASVLSGFKDYAQNLSETAKNAAIAAGKSGKTTLAVSQEVYNFAQRVGDVAAAAQEAGNAAEQFAAGEAANGQTVFDMYEKIYFLLKHTDDMMFQMNLLRFFSGIETERIGCGREVFIPIDNSYDKLTADLAEKKPGVLEIIRDIMLLLRGEVTNDIKSKIDEAALLVENEINCGQNIAEQMKKAAKSVSTGAGYMFMADRLNLEISALYRAKDFLKTEFADTEQIKSTVYQIEDFAFSMNICAFNAKIETERSGGNEEYLKTANLLLAYPPRLQKLAASFENLAEEILKLKKLLSGNENESKNVKLSKDISDIVFQGKILANQFGLEAHRLQNSGIIAVSEKADASNKLVRGITFVENTQDAVETMKEYCNAVKELAALIRREAEKVAPFEYIASEYEAFAERIAARIK